jgi:hypothetical protein
MNVTGEWLGNSSVVCLGGSAVHQARDAITLRQPEGSTSFVATSLSQS